MGLGVPVTAGSGRNLKITTAGDVELALKAMLAASWDGVGLQNAVALKRLGTVRLPARRRRCRDFF